MVKELMSHVKVVMLKALYWELTMQKFGDLCTKKNKLIIKFFDTALVLNF